jgi:hypothetical protein
MVPSAKAEYKQGIGYMLIEQNYLDVSYLVIAFSKLKGEGVLWWNLLSIENQLIKNQNQNKKGLFHKECRCGVLLNDSTGLYKNQSFRNHL